MQPTVQLERNLHQENQIILSAVELLTKNILEIIILIKLIKLNILLRLNIMIRVSQFVRNGQLFH